jgi:membrane associated rhomboid family serine protease
MPTQRVDSKRPLFIFIFLLVTIIALLLLGGVNGMMDESGSVIMIHWNWSQLLIGLAIGVLIGLLMRRRNDK